MVQHFSANDFQSEVLESNIPVLIDFYADWCGPCKMMSPVLEQIAKEMEGSIKVGKINVDEEPELASRFGVMSIPNFVLIKDGNACDQVIGAVPKEALVSKIKAVLA